MAGTCATVPIKFSFTQICVRGFFIFTSGVMLVACVLPRYTSCRARTLSTPQQRAHTSPRWGVLQRRVSVAFRIRRYTAAIASRPQREIGQVWVVALLVLLIALNDPLYIARIYVRRRVTSLVCSPLAARHCSPPRSWRSLESRTMTDGWQPCTLRCLCAFSGRPTSTYRHLTRAWSFALLLQQVFGQILFSGSLFLFWLVYADGMSSANRERHFCSFFVPKLLLVCTYVGVASTMFVLHGRLPDRINMTDVAACHRMEPCRESTELWNACCRSRVSFPPLRGALRFFRALFSTQTERSWG